MIDKTNMEYWDQIKVGSIIQLDDQQTLEFLIEQGLTVSSNGADFEVVRVKDISLNNDSIKMKLVYLQLDKIVWYLVINNIEEEISLQIYYQEDDFECGNREDMIKNGWLYLFEKPEDIENYLVEDLALATYLVESDDNNTEIVYKSELGTMFGSSFEDDVEDFASVVSLLTATECEDTNLLIIELCNVNVDEQLDEDGNTIEDPIVNIDSSNSYIMFLRGCPVEMNDVEILK